MTKLQKQGAVIALRTYLKTANLYQQDVDGSRILFYSVISTLYIGILEADLVTVDPRKKRDG